MLIRPSIKSFGHHKSSKEQISSKMRCFTNNRKEIYVNQKSNIFKLNSTNLYEEACKRYRDITECKVRLEKELRNAPSGIVHVVKSGKRIQFYFREDKSDKFGKYIRKSEENIIR